MAVDKHSSARPGRQFYLLWAGQTISQIGDYVAYFTVPAFVSVLTARATDFAIVFAAENIPTLIFGFTGGVLLDRISFRATAIGSDLGRAAVFIALAFIAMSDAPPLWSIFALAFVIGTLAAGFNAALPSFVPFVVERDHLEHANSRLSLTQQISFVVAPALGGLIVAAWGFATSFVINAVTFLASAVSLALVRPIREFERPESDSSFRIELTTGLRFLWANDHLRLATLAAAGANFTVAFIEATLILLGRQVFGIEEFTSLGLVFGALGAGGVVGALSAPLILSRVGLGRAFVVGMIVFASGITAMGFQRTLVGVALALFAGMIGLPWMNIALVTMRQAYTPDDLLGRVTSASRSIAWGTLPIGALVSGLLADYLFGLEVMIIVGPTVLLIGTLFLFLTPLWRNSGE